MKIIHLSDLHIGKRINEFSMIEDQQYILLQILSIIRSEAPDAVIIAGDVYDRSLPPTEAVTELDDFIYKLSLEKFDTFIISGNHDSPERLAFGSRIMAKSGIHLSPVYNGHVEPISLTDEFGEVNFYMLPFIKSFHVKNIFPDRAEDISSYTDAVRIAVENMNVDYSKRNIIISHQFVTGASRSDSEIISVGGSDNVDSFVYEQFDYAALGHIHTPQIIGGKQHIRYCGTPLKYSFSEVADKSVTVVELMQKGSLNIRQIPLKPLRDMRTIRDTFENIYSNGPSDPNKDDYIRAILTDENEVDSAMSKLKKIYPNIMELSYAKNQRSGENGTMLFSEIESKGPLKLFEDFFKSSEKRPLKDEEKAFIQKIIEEIEEEENETD